MSQIEYKQEKSFVVPHLIAYDSAHVKYGVWTWPKAASTRIRIFLHLQLFLSRCGFRPRAAGEFETEYGYFLICIPEREKNKSATPDTQTVWFRDGNEI